MEKEKKKYRNLEEQQKSDRQQREKERADWGRKQDRVLGIPQKERPFSKRETRKVQTSGPTLDRTSTFSIKKKRPGFVGKW